MTHDRPAQDRLVADRLGYRIGSRSVLGSISFRLGDGDLVALLGANGAGKTTLLRLLLGLLKPASGRVLLDGKPLAMHARRTIGQRLAYVPQAHVAAFPYRVDEVVALGRLPASTIGRGVSPEDRAVAQAAMTRLGIAHLADRPYTRISGGERQSVLIARALAQGARILILDEPATGLDFGQQVRLSDILRDLAGDGFAVLSTTHDPWRAHTAFDRAILLQDGSLVADGPAKAVITEASVQALYGLRNVAEPPGGPHPFGD